MKDQRFICRECGFKFVVKIYEDGEAEEKRVQGGPVVCPRCHSGNIERN